MLIQLIVVAQPCPAGTIYVQAGIEGDNSAPQNPTPQPNQYADYWNQGRDAASAAGSLPGSSASAVISLLPSSHPGIYFSTQGAATGEIAGSPFYDSLQSAVVQWRDIIRVSGAEPLPDSLRLTFAASGTINLVASGLGPAAYALVGFQMQHAFAELLPQGVSPGNNFNFGDTSGISASVGTLPKPGGGITPFNVQGYAGPSVHVDPTTNTASISGAVTWHSTFDIAFSQSDGGYPFTLTAYNQSDSLLLGSGTYADFAHTIQLTAVTLNDGSRVPGVITFDSGFQLSSIPEPPSLVVLGSAVLAGLGWISWRHRRAA
jgi:hypothetical protein